MNVSEVKDKDKKALTIELLESVGLNEEKGDRRELKLSGYEEQRSLLLEVLHMMRRL